VECLREEAARIEAQLLELRDSGSINWTWKFSLGLGLLKWIQETGSPRPQPALVDYLEGLGEYVDPDFFEQLGQSGLISADPGMSTYRDRLGTQVPSGVSVKSSAR
jgi:hypothetical protein